jgi:glycosyltransferase involved in cell wall biosynthesis
MTVRRGDPAALAAALRTVVSDPAKAEAMVAAGRRRAQRFTWERTARRVWAVHIDLYRRKNTEGGHATGWSSAPDVL